MIDRILCIAFNIAPASYAERISIIISERRCAKRWADAVDAHKAAGGVVVTHSWAGGEQSVLVGGDA
jgi:hypothetical protein